MIKQAGAAGVASLVLGREAVAAPRRAVEGRVRQSVCRWCYNQIPLRDFFQGVADLGLTAVDLLGEDEWPIAQEYGLTCSMGWAPDEISIPDGLNDRANHDRIIHALERLIPKAAEMGVPNVIAFFGNRKGISDAEGAANCVVGLQRIKPLAEEHGVNVCLELLNSKVDHADYHGDHTNFGAEIMRAVDSSHIKLLYDIYHMQIMEGDVIRTIRENQQWIGHYHTGGVPGRNEIDAAQELHYPAIVAAIADTGFTGYLAHEFIPTRDPLASLAEAVALCVV